MEQLAFPRDRGRPERGQTASEPAAFESGTVIPAGAWVNPTAGPTVGFGFPGYMDPIEVGEVSRVLYVKSDYGPTTVMGNIIDGGIANGSVVGPVPEPSTVVLLGTGMLVLCVYVGFLIYIRRNTG